MSRRKWMAVVSLAGLFLGVYLTLYHYGFIGTLACNVSSCEKVQTSRWSMLFGLPVATWGSHKPAKRYAEDQGDRHEHKEHEHDQRALQRSNQNAEILEDAESALRNRDRDRRADTDRRVSHHDADELEHLSLIHISEPTRLLSIS